LSIEEGRKNEIRERYGEKVEIERKQQRFALR